MYMQACIADNVIEMYQNPEITRLWSRNHFTEVIAHKFHVLNREVGNELQLNCEQWY